MAETGRKRRRDQDQFVTTRFKYESEQAGQELSSRDIIAFYDLRRPQYDGTSSPSVFHLIFGGRFAAAAVVWVVQGTVI